MATLLNAIPVILNHEGGYNCPFPGSGETYAGIDRNYSANWEGWKIIDTIKRTLPINCKKHSEAKFNNQQLQTQVNSWYQQTLKQYFDNADLFANQQLLNFLADFVWHKPYRAIAIANQVAKIINPITVTNPYKITPQVATTANVNEAQFYRLLRQYRIAYYNNPAALNNRWTERFTTTRQGLLNRVNKFPTKLTTPNNWFFGLFT